MRAEVAPIVSPPSPASRAPFGELLAPLCAGVAVVMAVVLARFAITGLLPWPDCRFREWTSLPCPGCGGLRSLAAWSWGAWGEALAWNPIVGLGAVALSLWAISALIDLTCATHLLARWQSLTRVPSLRWAVWIVLAGNILYLWFRLPR